MTPYDLQQNFTDLLHTDTRPFARRNLFQIRHGRKRTHLHAVRILTAPPPQTGAAPPLIKSLTQSSIANAGTTATGSLLTGPLSPAAVNQHVLSDCWLLVAILLLLFRNPAFFDDLIVPLGNGFVVVQLYANGLIVQITTSLRVSLDYDRPDDGDIRIELLEKAYALFRNGISDYLQLNFGVVTSALAAFGLDTATAIPNASTITAALQAGKVVGLGTPSTAPSPWVQDHAYALRTLDASANFLLRNPWAGAVDLAPIPSATLNTPAIFNTAYLGTFPATKRLLASYVPRTSATLQPTTQETPTMITLSTTAPTLLPISAATLFDCKPESQGGRPDIGYLLSDGYAEFSLTASTAAPFTLTLPVAAIVTGQFQLSINGTPAATVPFPATASWATFTNVTASISLPTGPFTLRISPLNNAQYNLADLMITPARQMKSLAIDFDAHTATATYHDGTTALLT